MVPIPQRHVQGLVTVPKACAALVEDARNVVNAVNANYTVDDLLRFKSDDEKANLDQLTKKFAADATACYAHVKVGLLDIAAEVYMTTHPEEAATIRAQLKSNCTALATRLLLEFEGRLDKDQQNTPIVAKILAASRQAHSDLRNYLANPALRYDSLRVFTHEDEADEASIRVMHFLKYPAPDIIGQTMIEVFGGSAYAATCRKALENGETIAYGGLIDDHHGECWRAFRARSLSKALDTCGENWPATP